MIDPEFYERARKLDRAAVERVLAEVYPMVHRVALGLSGREEVGRKVARSIMRRGVEQIRRWRREGDAERWFLHHTVLLTRRVAAGAASPGEDVLVRTTATASPEYVAFVRALRKLAHQPREAVLLREAEQLDARQLAVAMDCSTEAAANHLATGRRQLQQVAGAEMDALLRQVAEAYQQLTPKETLVLPMLRRTARRFVWPRRVWRLVRGVVTLAVLAGVAYLVYRYLPVLDY